MLASTKITFGVKKNPGENGKQWHSTWNKTRIAAWVSEQSRCGTIKYPFEDGKTSMGSNMYCPA